MARKRSKGGPIPVTAFGKFVAVIDPFPSGPLVTVRPDLGPPFRTTGGTSPIYMAAAAELQKKWPEEIDHEAAVQMLVTAWGGAEKARQQG